MQTIRDELPEKITYCDIFLIGWSFSAILPLISHLVAKICPGSEAAAGVLKTLFHWIILLEFVFGLAWVIYKYSSVWKLL
jgi:hypothetical protein